MSTMSLLGPSGLERATLALNCLLAAGPVRIQTWVSRHTGAVEKMGRTEIFARDSIVELSISLQPKAVIRRSGGLTFGGPG